MTTREEDLTMDARDLGAWKTTKRDKEKTGLEFMRPILESRIWGLVWGILMQFTVRSPFSIDNFTIMIKGDRILCKKRPCYIV